MRWFTKRDKKNTLHFAALSSTATRALLDGHNKLANIHLTFKLRTPREDGVTGEIIDEIEVELDLFEASKFASQLLASLDAASPKVPRGAARIPWEG